MPATKIITQKLIKSLQSVHRTRLKSVFFGVDALLRGGRLSLTEQGSSASGTVSPKHNIKRIDRGLGNRHIPCDMPTFCKAITLLYVEPGTQPVILIDWTRRLYTQHPCRIAGP